MGVCTWRRWEATASKNWRCFPFVCSTIHNPQSNANKQQVPNHNAQCPILLRLELGLATCSRLKTLPLFLFLANFYGQFFIFEIQITLKQSFVNICIREQRFSNWFVWILPPSLSSTSNILAWIHWTLWQKKYLIGILSKNLDWMTFLGLGILIHFRKGSFLLTVKACLVRQDH